MGLMGKLGKLYRGEHRRPQNRTFGHQTTCSSLLLMMGGKGLGAYGFVALAFCGRCTKTAMTRRAIALGKSGGLIGCCVFQSVGMDCSVLGT